VSIEHPQVNKKAVSALVELFMFSVQKLEFPNFQQNSHCSHCIDMFQRRLSDMQIEPLQTSPEKGYGIGSIETPPWPVAFVQQPFVNADAQIAQKAHTETNPCSW